MVKTFYLSNGLKVAMEYMPQYRSVSMGVWVKAGSVNENKQTNGMAHVIEHMLFKGTEKRTARELADAHDRNRREYGCLYDERIYMLLHEDAV